jgi:hypothetical protein
LCNSASFAVELAFIVVPMREAAWTQNVKIATEKWVLKLAVAEYVRH